MKTLHFLLLLATVTLTIVAGENSVIGTINDNTTWFLSNLSVHPAMTASLEYHVQYPDVEGRSRPMITFYYNGQDSPNLEAKCRRDLTGQLRNEDLVVPLNQEYREKFICYKDANIWYCSGKTKIQDFEPKSYSFSVCFDCHDVQSGNLNGLYYNVTIYDESNRTSCVDLKMAQWQRIDQCERSYQFAAIPNQVGGTDLNTTLWELEQVRGYVDRLIDLVSQTSCLLELYQVLCLVALPECLPEENQIVLPCREYCETQLYNCFRTGSRLLVEFIFNCKCLPSRNDSDHCFKPVDVCGPTPGINHGFILEGDKLFTTVGHVVHYACYHSWILTGNANSTCQMSGEWTTPPECVKLTNSSGSFNSYLLAVKITVFLTFKNGLKAFVWWC